NVPDVDKARAGEDDGVADAVRQAEERLGETGRVLLRPSWTEPLVRVMVEAATQDQAEDVAGGLADVVKERIAPGGRRDAGAGSRVLYGQVGGLSDVRAWGRVVRGQNPAGARGRDRASMDFLAVVVGAVLSLGASPLLLVALFLP